MSGDVGKGLDPKRDEQETRCTTGDGSEVEGTSEGEGSGVKQSGVRGFPLHFLFDAGFNAARSFDNSSRKHFCFLPKHSLHATPAGVWPRGTPRATASFHLLIRAGSTQQRDLQPVDPPHQAGPSRSSSSGTFAFPFPFLGEAPSSTSMAPSGW